MEDSTNEHPPPLKTSTTTPPGVTINDGDAIDVIQDGANFLDDDLSSDEDDTYGNDDDDDEEESIYRPYNKLCYERQVLAVEEEKRKLEAQKNRIQEGRLVDGELIFDDNEGDEEEKIEKDPGLVDGNELPESFGSPPKDLINKPMDEIDSHRIETSFVVVASRFKRLYIYRFSSTPAFLCLSPWNPIRRIALRIATNQYFDYCVIATILINCVFLALPPQGWDTFTEYIFTAIYTFECIVKLLARGFFFHQYAYLRDLWNWLDFTVIMIAYVTILIEQTGSQSSDIGNLSALRAFRVLRALKTVSIVPGLKTIISALLKSMRMFAEVIVLTLFCMMVFALFALQVYVGVLRQKCVADIPAGTVNTDYEWVQYVKNKSNWAPDGLEYIICGNASGAGRCPMNYTCLPDLGDNPNFGYSGFDNFGWAMLNAFQLITLDFWEDPYDRIIRANGPWNIIFFIVVVFFGSFYLINLMLAVVSMSYEEEASQNKQDKMRERERSRKKDQAKKDKKAVRKKTSKSKKKQDSSKSDTNHLRVMSAVKGLTSSNSSLHSVGNGALPMKPAMQGGIAAENKSEHNNKGRSTSLTMLDSSKSDLLTSFRSKGNHVGVVNPAHDADLDSLDSDENDGDPPKVTIRAPMTWDTSSDDEDDDIYDPDADDDELIDRNCECCAQCCRRYIEWLKFQNKIYKIVSDLAFELFITACIVLNVIVMALEFHGMSEELRSGLQVANYVFSAIFIVEAIVKLLALSKLYFKSGWNVFDLFIVIITIADILIDISGANQDLSYLKSFRLLRLLRVFKLAQTWKTMRLLLSIILSTMSALGNLTFILGIIIYIFAVIGMELFRESYIPEKFASGEKPRWNFDDFWHSLILIFRVLCGEWIEPLWDCMQARGELCMIVFLPSLVIGNFMVLNLFLALLLNSFASDSIQKNDKDTKEESKMKQGWQRLKGLFRAKGGSVEPTADKKPSIASIIVELKRQKDLREKMEREEEEEEDVEKGLDRVSEKDGKETKVSTVDEKKKEKLTLRINGDVSPSPNSSPNGTVKIPSLGKPIDSSQVQRRLSVIFTKNHGTADASNGSVSPSAANGNQKSDLTKTNSIPAIKVNDQKVDDVERPQVDDEDEEAASNVMVDCLPTICHRKCCPGYFDDKNDSPHYQRWFRMRTFMHKIAVNSAFEYLILVFIFASSVTLVFEDIYIDQMPKRKEILYYLDIVFVTIFVVEMFIKWIGLGFKKYFTTFWTILDFIIVVISISSLAADSAGQGDLDSFKALRTLRAFRPLRAISRWQGMKIVVNALMYAIPAIFNVAVVCTIFWLVFSIAGVQLYGGKFYKCVDADGERLDCSIIANRSQCEALADSMGYSWENSLVNFDNVINGFLALLQVATFEGWMELMDDAVDSPKEVDQQPCYMRDFHQYWFFVVFIVVGAFFTLNLFIGVIIDNFNMLKKKYEGGYVDVLLTPSQKNYYNTMKKLGSRKPQKTIKRPKNKVQCFFFDVSMSSKFEFAIVVLIFLNMISMAQEHYQQSQAYTDTLDIMNIIFTTIFTLEALVKIFGMRWHYLRRPWNVFDLIVVILSVIGVILDDILSNVFVTPSLLRVVRIFRIGRVLRLIKAAKGIRKLLFALVISLPALFNIAMLLFLVVFIYAIFGMTIFGFVKTTPSMSDVVNFQTFPNSLLLLFRLCTAAGWNEILDPLMISKPNCNDTHVTMPDYSIIERSGGDCGDSILAPLFMSTFVMLTFLIIINLYIAVILENFSQAHEQEEVGITEDDFEMFYMTWEQYDPHATQFIKYHQLSDFVADLDPPLGMAKPNEIALVAFDLPIYERDRLHCLDVLVGLVKHVLGGVEETDQFKLLKQQIEEKFKEAFPTRAQLKICSTTLGRKKEDVAAKTLQRAWRQHRAQQNIRKITEMAMEAKLAREGGARNSIIFGFRDRENSLRPSSQPSAAKPPSRPAKKSTAKTKPAAAAELIKQTAPEKPIDPAIVKSATKPVEVVVETSKPVEEKPKPIPILVEQKPVEAVAQVLKPVEAETKPKPATKPVEQKPVVAVTPTLKPVKAETKPKSATKPVEKKPVEAVVLTTNPVEVDTQPKPVQVEAVVPPTKPAQVAAKRKSGMAKRAMSKPSVTDIEPPSDVDIDMEL